MGEPQTIYTVHYHEMRTFPKPHYWNMECDLVFLEDSTPVAVLDWQDLGQGRKIPALTVALDPLLLTPIPFEPGHYSYRGPIQRPQSLQ